MIKFKNKKQLIIFDLDGVLIDSKKNMKIAWESANKKFNLNLPFKKYFTQIGKPFNDILNSFKIKNKKKIQKQFFKVSSNNINKIKLYKNIENTLNKINSKKNIYTAIVTSKNKKRTNKILKFFNIKVDFVQCPSKNLNGKPSPDQIIEVIKRFKIKKSKCVYIGDTNFDNIAAKKSKIDFILAKYGYQIGIRKHKHSINNISEILNIL